MTRAWPVAGRLPWGGKGVSAPEVMGQAFASFPTEHSWASFPRLFSPPRRLHPASAPSPGLCTPDGGSVRPASCPQSWVLAVVSSGRVGAGWGSLQLPCHAPHTAAPLGCRPVAPETQSQLPGGDSADRQPQPWAGWWQGPLESRDPAGPSAPPALSPPGSLPAASPRGQPVGPPLPPARLCGPVSRPLWVLWRRVRGNSWNQRQLSGHKPRGRCPHLSV